MYTKYSRHPKFVTHSSLLPIPRYRLHTLREYTILKIAIVFNAKCTFIHTLGYSSNCSLTAQKRFSKTIRDKISVPWLLHVLNLHFENLKKFATINSNILFLRTISILIVTISMWTISIWTWTQYMQIYYIYKIIEIVHIKKYIYIWIYCCKTLCYFHYVRLKLYNAVFICI